MNKVLFCILCCFCIAINGKAQDSEYLRSKNRSLMLGIGHSSIMDTYLSPYNYSGTTYGLIAESKSLSRNKLFVRQHLLSLDYTNASNYSGRGSYHAGFADYTFSLMRKYEVSSDLHAMIGGAGDLLIGGIYNVRNNNNPAQAKVHLNLDLSGIIDYRFFIRNHPFVLNYQLKIPMAGVGFAPEYGESYYEVFELGNRDNVIHFLSLHNQWIFRNQITIEFPFWGNSLRLGFVGNIMQSRINHLETSVVTNSFLLGVSGDILHLNRRKRVARGEY